MAKVMQQYGIRWPGGSVFSFGSREAAEDELKRDGRGVGALVVHEGVPGAAASSWTEWREVEPEA